MSKTSKKYFSDDFLKEIWTPFMREIKKADTYKEVIKALKLALTPQEITLIEKRLGVKYLLSKNTAIKEIGKIMDVNRPTVRFVRDDFKRKEYKKLPRYENSKLSKTGNQGIFRKYSYIRKIK